MPHQGDPYFSLRAPESYRLYVVERTGVRRPFHDTQTLEVKDDRGITIARLTGKLIHSMVIHELNAAELRVEVLVGRSAGRSATPLMYPEVRRALIAEHRSRRRRPRASEKDAPVGAAP